jgi:hypothetical protein
LNTGLRCVRITESPAIVAPSGVSYTGSVFELSLAPSFSWSGGGFDVVNFVTTSTGQLVLGCDLVANLRVRLCLLFQQDPHEPQHGPGPMSY